MDMPSTITLERSLQMHRGVYALLCAAVFLTPGAATADTVNVLYAGSLVNLMEHGIGPAFDTASPDISRY
jgi:hypothetical protein